MRALEHRGQRDRNERFVCYLEGDPGLLAIWGSKGKDMRHIEEIEHAGFPVTIECDWIAPDPYEATNFGRRYWIRELDHLQIIR